MAYAQFTLATLRVRLHDKRDGILQWTPEEEQLAINKALRFWNLLTGYWQRTALQNTGNGTVEYTLPATMVYGARVAVSGLPLTVTSLTELDLMRPSWRSETVASGGSVPTVPTLWAPCSLLRIAIWPQMASVVVNGLRVDGVSATPVLSEPADFIDLGEELLEVLLNYCLHLLAFKIGGPTFQQTVPHYRAFLRAAAEENGILKANKKFRRWAGLDRRIDLLKLDKEPTQLDSIIGGV